MKLTRIGGPTVLVELDGWHILIDPTFDAPGRRYSFGWGTSSRKTLGPTVAADDLGRIDLALVSHDHHADNLDDAGRELLRSAGAVVTTASGAGRMAQRMPLANLHGLRGVSACCCRAPGQACRPSRSRPRHAATDRRSVTPSSAM